MSQALVPLPGEVLPRPRRGGFRLWFLAAAIGPLVGIAVVLMIVLIDFGSFVAFGAARGRLSSHLADAPWQTRLIGPIVGGALISLVLRIGIGNGWGPRPRPFGLVDVVGARRLRGTIRATTLSLRDAFLSGLASIVSLAWGASAGRESPAMHLGAALGLLPGRLLGLDLPSRRLLVAVGVASAFAAVLHAPLAAVFIARELIVPRLRFQALGPIALGAATAWLTSLAALGAPIIAVPAIGDINAGYYLIVLIVAPILAAIAWGAAFVWSRAPAAVEAAAGFVHLPVWLLPAIGGLAIGGLAIVFPLAIGIGYEPLVAALGAGYSALLLPGLALAKILVSAVTFAFRWGGGPIAPALYAGAMFGSAFGIVAGYTFGDPATAQVVLGLVGMAVFLAVLLEAPFAAALLALELSRSPEIGVASLVAALAAMFLVRRFAPAPAQAPPDPMRWR